MEAMSSPGHERATWSDVQNALLPRSGKVVLTSMEADGGERVAVWTLRKAVN